VVRRQAEVGRRLLREVEGIFGAVTALFLLASFLSYAPGEAGRNVCGPVGHATADILVPALGLAAYLIPLYLGVLAWHLLREDGPAIPIGKAVGCTVLVLAAATTFALTRESASGITAGGWLGGFVAAELRAFLGTFGAAIVTTALLVLSIQLSTEASLPALGRAISQGAMTLGTSAFTQARGWRQACLKAWAARVAARAAAKAEAKVRQSDPVPAARAKPSIVVAKPIVKLTPADQVGTGDQKRSRRPSKAEQQPELPFQAKGTYTVPPLSLLDPPVLPTVLVDEEALIALSRILESKLKDFGVSGRVVAVQPGPVITTFEFEPAPGVKVNRIITLSDDLSMALRALSVRILAPIPGKAVVGIEVSNPRREKVYMGEVLRSDAYSGTQSRLALALGKDPTGQPFVADLARMPHLLMAGATGTGKSVSINAMLLSMLFRSSPRDVRFIMIDPKMLELSVYEDIPHLLVPVVTDPKRASAALSNVIREMQYRYRLLHAKGVRSLENYNRLIARQEAEEKGKVDLIELDDPVDDADDDLAAEVEEAVERASPIRSDDAPLVHEHLPHIVIVIDEFADLIMTAGRDVETSITRLAQKARAAGIHIILATQRPSVDVITGLIKANFPARVSFQVTSRPDSRTILDCIGAERLLGEGDMLFMPPGTARVQRLHGAFVSDEEVIRVIEFIKRQGKPEYRMELLTAEEEPEGGEAGEEPYDEMYDEAVRIVTESGQASISWVQRRLRVGYNRAARMVERMEQEGVVSTSEGGRPREVLARRIDSLDG
jgi:S-DNA-T family DNA segregation ATPase FtsK/SpoIIIE